MKRINIIYIFHLLLFVLVAFGYLPRSIVPFWILALAVYFIVAPLEEIILFFVRSIPLFIAIPTASGFDSFNMWRILSILIFLRWARWNFIKNLFRFRFSVVGFCLLALLILSVLSITQATDVTLAVKRIIYFLNLSLIGIVINYYLQNKPEFRKEIVPNIAIATIVAVSFGFIQLISIYTMNIFQFVDWWGNIVERNIFGNAWADIALKANTWFAYFGDKLSLRMFSIFPDSHSFPIFLILGIPAIMAIFLKKVIANNVVFKGFLRTRGHIGVLFVPICLLAVILSGTRGMWVAGGISIIWAILVTFWAKKRRLDVYRIDAFKYLAGYLVLFAILFGIAYPIFGSPQFQISRDDGGLLSKRVRSVFDFSETSNARRIEIWKDSLRSITKHPFLGVGINNFPVVVNEDFAKVKAGSSAHNIYLHIAAEMGIPALILVLILLWKLLVDCWQKYFSENDPLLLIYFGASLIFIPWNLVYSLTDVALFDERAFLLFVVSTAMIWSDKKTPEGVK